MRLGIVVRAMVISEVLLAASVQAQLDSSCVVSVLNRSARVATDGTWVIPNVPAVAERVRVRATCAAANGATRTGQSGFITVPASGVLQVADIVFDQPALIPARLQLVGDSGTLTVAGGTLQVLATVFYGDASSRNVTAPDTGTTYRTSNAAIASVDASGLVTVHTSGTALISAINEGALGVLQVTVSLSGDTDGDGIPDDWERSHGLDPNNAVDGAADPDHDGLTNLREFQLGTEPQKADTDGDGLKDGEEVDRYHTNPLLWDSDGDGISDGLEVRSASDPLDAASFNLSSVVASVDFAPKNFQIVANDALGGGSRQLRVTATLVDGRALDVTARRYGTQYASSDLLIANFGAEDGRVYAGNAGDATVTVSVAGRSMGTSVRVVRFAPTALAFLPLGASNSVSVSGDYAYVANGAAGLAVVDVSNLSAPALVATLDTPGNANDVRVLGTLAFVADGDHGVEIVDVGVPTSPRIVGQVATPGVATDLSVSGNLVYVADESGLRIVDASAPEAPVLLGSVDLPGGRASGVDVSGGYAVVADGQGGVVVVNVTNPAAPSVTGRVGTRPDGTSHAMDLVVRDRFAYVADGAGPTLGGLRVIDFSDPTTPAVVGSTSDAFGLTNVAVEKGMALASDFYFQNGVPLWSLDGGTNPAGAGTLDFEVLNGVVRDDNGQGIDLRDGVVFMVGVRDQIRDNTVNGNGGLFIGRYAQYQDDAGIAPTVSVTSPANGASVAAGSTLTLAADAHDDVQVESVDFLVNGARVATIARPPYRFSYTVPSGATILSIVAVAHDTGGNQASSEPVVVSNAQYEAPNVRLLAPVDGDSVVAGSLLPLAASANGQHEIRRVEFFVNGVSVASATTAPYRASYAVPLSAVHLSVTAVAHDDFSASSPSASAAVSVVANEPPLVRILQPAEGATAVAGGVVHVLVGASDDTGVASVTLKQDGVDVHQWTSTPYEADLRLPTGSSSVLQATAVDSAGQSSTSASVTLHLITSDPLTTAIGRVLDPQGQPSGGTTVVCKGLTAVTAADGSFSLPGIPTALGNVRCAARRTDAGIQSAGTSASVAPVLGGSTNVGTIHLALLPGFLYPHAQVSVGDDVPVVRAADLNGDGRDDLVSGTRIGIALSFGRPDGSFGDKVDLGLDLGGVSDLALADADRDGNVDILAAEGTTLGLATFLGNGDGTFRAPVMTSGAALRLAVGDFNGDGKPDVIVTGTTTAFVNLGNGDGTFVRAQQLAFGGPLAVGDIDGDGKLDVAGGASYFLGQGSGTFGAALTFGGYGGGARAVALADLNGDGRADRVAVMSDSFYNPAKVLVQFALASGGYSLPVTLSPITYFGASRSGNDVKVADFDGDGFLDLAVVNTGSNDITVFRGNGAGGFPSSRVLSTGWAPLCIEAADLDHDGLLDLLSGNSVESVSVLFGEAGGEFLTDRRVAAGGGPDSVVAADLDGDGVQDLLVPDYSASKLIVLRGNGDGSFLPGAQLSATRPWAPMAADLNGDGKIDILVSSNHSIAVLLGLGGGAFGPAQYFPAGTCPDFLAVGDIDRDGHLDVVTGDDCDNVANILGGRGDGVFGAPRAISLGLGTNGRPVEPRGFDLADLDHDGNLDIISANDSYSGGATVVLGTGGGSFGSAQALAVGDYPQAVLAADFDGDGKLDLAVANDDDVSILLGRGDGTFAPQARFPAALFPNSMVSGDFDGDGIVDLALIDEGGNAVRVLRGVGDGSFRAAESYGVADCPRGLVSADLNGDALPDLMTSAYCSKEVSILLHR
jgi:hypothetical protein